MESDLVVGLILTALAYAGLIWAVVHGKHVVEQVMRGEYLHHPNPEHRPADGGAGSPAGGPGAEETGGESRGKETPRE